MYIQHMLIQKTGVFTINVFSQTLSPFYILIYFDEHFFFCNVFYEFINTTAALWISSLIRVLR